MNLLLAIKRFFRSREEKEQLADLCALMEERCVETAVELPIEAQEEPKGIHEVFEIQNEEDFFFALVERSLYTLNTLGRESMPKGEKLIELIYCYRFEANGGGTMSYLSNSTGDDADRLDWAMETIGESTLAGHFKKIKKAFSRGVIPSDRGKRCDHMELWNSRIEKLCDAMDEDYFKLEDSDAENLLAQSVRWARVNKEQFE